MQNSERLATVLQQYHLSPVDWQVLRVFGGGSMLSAHVAKLAASESQDDSLGTATQSACRAAMTRLLRSGLIAMVDAEALRDISGQLRKNGVADPVYGFPAVGDVDFTERGAQIYSAIIDRVFGNDFLVEAQVHHDTYRDVYTTSKVTMFTLMRVFPGCVETKIISRWCIFWWRCFSSGYHIRLFVRESEKTKGDR